MYERGSAHQVELCQRGREVRWTLMNSVRLGGALWALSTCLYTAAHIT